MGKHSLVTAGGANNHPPKTHAASHKSGGSDEIKLHELGAPTGAVAGNAQQATGWANPTAAQSLVTRDFLDLSRNPNNEVVQFDDFFYNLMPAQNLAFPGPGSFFFAAAGVGTAMTLLASTATERGYLNCNVRTATGIGGIVSGVVWSVVNANELYFTHRGALTQLSNGTDTFTWHAGLFATQVTAPPNCLEFRTDTNTNYQFVSSKAGVPVTIDTGIPVDTAIHRWEIKKAPSGAALGFIDGVNVTGAGIAFADLPVVMMFGGVELVNTAGVATTRNWTVDFIGIRERPAAPRGV